MLVRTADKFGFLLVLAALAVPADAQKHTVIPLIPAPAWHLVRSQPAAVEAVREWGGDPAIEREYGVKTLEHRTYHHGEQTAEVVVEEALDPSAAYGLLTFYQTDLMAPAKEMKFTLLGPQGAQMARGRFFVRARLTNPSEVSASQWQSLLVQIGGAEPPSDELSRLPSPLPTKGLIPGTEKYLLGLEAARRVLPGFRSDLIGFPQGAEVRVGSYRVGKAVTTILAINYPTPDIARARFGAMKGFLEINTDRGNDSVYGRRSGSYVLLVLSADSAKSAEEVLGLFQITSQVSWNERAPNEKAFTLQVARLVLANILLSCFVAGFAVGGGLLIFLGRRVARKWFPKWEWADPDREAITTLKLT